MKQKQLECYCFFLLPIPWIAEGKNWISALFEIMFIGTYKKLAHQFDNLEGHANEYTV